MVRITAEVLLYAPQCTNALGERELSLRGQKIADIENLGATQNQFEAIDLSDNEIVKLDGFPPLSRLQSLYVSNNRISRIAPGLGAFLPRLHTLVLSNNRLQQLVDLDPLADFSRLRTLSLLDNGVTKQSNYRLYLIHKIPTLRLLDFRKIKQEERSAARKLFKKAGEKAKKEGAKAKTFVPGETAASTAGSAAETEAAAAEPPSTDAAAVAATAKPKATPEQLLAIKAAIANAATLEEVAKLENALKEGVLPTSASATAEDKMEEG